METINNAASCKICHHGWNDGTLTLPLVVGDKVSEATSGASKEANKSVAKDSNASLGTRASAAKDAAGDKMDETKSSVCIFITSFITTC